LTVAGNSLIHNNFPEERVRQKEQLSGKEVTKGEGVADHTAIRAKFITPTCNVFPDLCIYFILF